MLSSKDFQDASQTIIRDYISCIQELATRGKISERLKERLFSSRDEVISIAREELDLDVRGGYTARRTMIRQLDDEVSLLTPESTTPPEQPTPSENSQPVEEGAQQAPEEPEPELSTGEQGSSTRRPWWRRIFGS
jgi:hypothetical protein